MFDNWEYPLSGIKKSHTFTSLKANGLNHHLMKIFKSRLDFILDFCGVDIDIKKAGDGTRPPKGSTVSVHYVGTLTSGKEFDSSRKRGSPFQFKLGAGQVIKGWDEGVAQMSKGELSKLTITPDFGYGARGAGNVIPPNALSFFHGSKLPVQGVTVEIIEEGDGDYPSQGSLVSVHYTGMLEDGTVFDSSIKRGKPINFELGVGAVIRGWDEGIAQMTEGSKAKLTITPGTVGKILRPKVTTVFVAWSEIIFLNSSLVIQPLVEASILLLRAPLSWWPSYPKSGQFVTVHYVGTLLDGTKFDSSRDRGEPFTFQDEGIPQIAVGELAKLTISSDYAYGDRGVGDKIGPGATLIFEVEVGSQDRFHD
eukprot:gene7715-9036_t